MLDLLFLSMLNRSITAGIVILAVLVVRLLLKKAPKFFSYALWSVVLFRLICPFSFESAAALLPVNEAPIPKDIVYRAEPQINTGFKLIDHAVNPLLPGAVPASSINPLQIWAFAGSRIWVIGMAVLLTYSIVSFIRLKQKLIGAIPLRDRIYLADHINSPFVMGLIKPKIYLPSFVAENEQEFIIAHEQCHINRWDHIIRIFAFIALITHWLNPLVWLAFILSGKDMEMACDEAVMKKMDTDIRAEYSQSLLRFATGKKLIGATPLAFGEGNIKDRIKNVMRYKKPVLWISIVAAIAVTCIAVGLMSNAKSEPAPIETQGTPTKVLWKNRTEYVGNNSAVGNILTTLSFPDKMQYESFELQTKTPPYEIIIYLKSSENFLKDPDSLIGPGSAKDSAYHVSKLAFAQMEQNARIMFSLIGNVGKITFSVRQKDGGTFTRNFVRSSYEELYAKTAAYEGFQAVLDDIWGKENARDTEDIEKIPQSKLTYSQAVSLALTSADSKYFEGECIAEGHIILGYDEAGKSGTKIYALTSVGRYGFENNHFVKISGTGIIPAVVTLSGNNAVDIQYPEDGGKYKASLEKMFPQKYHKRIFENADDDYDDLKRQEQHYAKDYLSKIGRKAKIGEQSDFEYTSLSQSGISTEVSNRLENFYKVHNYYPSYIGAYERLENGIRMVYETSFHKNEAEIRFTKYNYDTKEKIEQFLVNAKTGDIDASAGTVAKTY